MLDGRFHLNSSPLGTILNLLSTIYFSDSVDELDDELGEDEDEEGDLFLFYRLDLDFFRLLLLVRFTISGLDEGEFLFLFLDLCRLSSFLVEEVFRFSNALFAGSSYELSPALSFSCPASSLELTKGEITFALCWSVCWDPAFFKLLDIIYCIKYISLDNISCSLFVVRAWPFRFTNKVEKGFRIGIHAG